MFYTNTIIIDGNSFISLLKVDSDGNLWSFRENHRFYQEYMAWLEEGNVPEEWNPEV